MLIHGEDSDLLGEDAKAEMQRRRRDMIYWKVQRRRHIPWLDEGENLAVVKDWVGRIETMLGLG